MSNPENPTPDDHQSSLDAMHQFEQLVWQQIACGRVTASEGEEAMGDFVEWVEEHEHKEDTDERG